MDQVDDNGPPPGIRRLLEHGRFARSLARALVRDEHDAEDLAQDAWVAALANPPATGAAAWLRAVTRNLACNLWRSRDRRRRREAAAGGTEATSSAADLAARAETLRRVMEAVHGLREPYRGTILLRFYDGLGPTEIAERTGVPLDTVRSRLQRALRMLRERLDGDHGGDRRAWTAAVLPLAGAAGDDAAATAATVEVAMTTSAKAGMAAAAVLLLAAWLALRGDREQDPAPAPEVASVPTPAPVPAMEPPPPAPPPPAVVEEEAPLPPPPPAPAPEPEPEPPLDPPPPADAPAPDESITIRYTGRVVDERRRPVAGAAVAALVEGRPAAATTSDGEGRFEARVPPGADGDRAWGSYELLFLATTEDGRAGTRTFLHRQVGEDMLRSLVIVVVPGRALEVSVVDEGGAVPGAEVVLACGSCALLRGRTDPSGHASLGPLPGMEGAASDLRLRGPILLSASVPGRGRGELSFAWPPAGEGPLVVRLSSRDIPVEVVDADTGKGIPGAVLWLRERVPPVEGGRDGATLPCRPEPEETRTDHHGRAMLRGASATADLFVGAGAEGYGEARGYGSGGRMVEAGRPVRFVLARSRRVWWPVTDAEGPIPSHGTVVSLHRGHLARSARDRSFGWEWGPLSAVEGRIEVSASEGARMVVDGAGGGAVWNGRRPSFDGEAVAPDGRIAVFHWDGTGDRGPAVSFRTPRTATIEILAGDGSPREGVEVAIIGEGSPGMLHTRGYGFTDAAGRAVIGGLYGGAARVVLRDPRRENLDEHASGRVDLEKGDAFLAIRLSERTPLEFVVHVRVNGEARLPPTYSFTVWQGVETTTFREGNIEPAMEDAAAGTLRCTAWLLRPREKLGLSLNAPGLYAGMMREVPAGRREGPVEVSFDLVPPLPPPPAPAAARREEVPGETPEARLLRILDTGRVTYRRSEGTVSDALVYVAAAQGINVVVDLSARDAASAEVDIDLVDRTLRDAIREIVGKADGLAFVVRGGVVVVARR